MKKLALVLGGGAAKGYAHLGLLQELEKNGVKPDLIVGTSMGALVGGLYASGISLKEMQEYALNFNSMGNFSLASTMFNGNLLNVDKVKKFLKKAFGDKNHEDCDIQFVAVASNLDNGEEMDFDTGLLRETVLASISIPAAFPTVKIGNNHYCDGGLVNNLPEDVARRMQPDAVIVSLDVIGPYDMQVEKHSFKMMQNLVNLCNLMTQKVVGLKPKMADLRIVISQPRVKLLDFSEESVKRAIQKGRQVAREHMEQILDLIKGETDEFNQ